MSVVAFNETAFLARYPEFVGTLSGVLPLYFAEAGLFLNNTDSSTVDDAAIRTLFLWMLTAHLALLNTGYPGQSPQGIVGRIDHATEGTVSVSAVMGPPSGSGAWYQQTRYGAEYWAASSRFRTLRFFPARDSKFFAPV